MGRWAHRRGKTAIIPRRNVLKIDNGNAPHEEEPQVQAEAGKTPHEEEAKVEGDAEDRVEGTLPRVLVR